MNLHSGGSTSSGTALTYDIFETSFGWIGAVVSDRGVRRISLPEPSREGAEVEIASFIAAGAVHDPGALRDIRSRLERYFSGEPEDLQSIPVDLDGLQTPFFERIRNACRTIPPGETRTYKWLAAEAGRPSASRAAGQAMARNPVPLLIPCHRVVGTDGSLHGFAGAVGLPLKARLLELESRTAGKPNGQLSMLG